MFCGTDTLFSISRSRSWILSRVAEIGGLVGALAEGGLEVRRWILIWAQALLISGEGMWCWKKSLRVLEAS